MNNYKLILSTVAFGVIMGLREQCATFWGRSIIAGLAFAVLGIALNEKRKHVK